MARSIEVTLAAYPKERVAASEAGKILVSKDNLLQLTGGLENDCLCVVETIDRSPPVRREASLCFSLVPLKKTTAQVTKAFFDASGLSPKDKCHITVAASASDSKAVPQAAEIIVEEVTVGKLSPIAASPHLVPCWIEHLLNKLDSFGVVFPGLVVSDVYRLRQKRSFVVKTVDGRDDKAARYVPEETKVSLPQNKLPYRPAATVMSPEGQQPGTLQTPAQQAAATAASDPLQPPAPQLLELQPIAGLESTVSKLNEFLSFFSPIWVRRPRHPCCIVIEGDAGTGKTMLLNHVAATRWGTVLSISPEDKLSAIQEAFEKASQQQPSIVLLDDIHRLLSEDRANRASVIKALGVFLDKHAYQGQYDVDAQAPEQIPRLVVLAACRDYVRDIPAELRSPLRFDNAVSTPLPDATCRQIILRSFNMSLPPDSSEDMIRHWSLHTHAFNGHDLWMLFRNATQLCQKRLRKEVGSSGSSLEKRPPAYLTNEDFKLAREVVTPSLMNGINVKPPPVYWNQIHGQEKLVWWLQKAVDMMNRPEAYPNDYEDRPRNFLLYGPPGCSKTMAAQALATESGLNYFSVKGGELLNQYVGESERGIRDLFRRASQAAPSVIFLDEIDGLAGRRSDFGDKSASSGRGPQTVPALLSEMDGFETLSKVMVLAATNRPETLDPALLRNGRFDSLFYVPPPNKEARRAILEGWAAKRKQVALDLDHLAELTEQYSGAEIVGICHKVKRQALQDQSHDLQITTEEFEAVIKKTPKTITNEMLEHFSKWNPSYY